MYAHSTLLCNDEETILSAHNISSTIYDFIINTVKVYKVYAGDNTAIPQLFNYLTCTVPS